MTKTAQKQIKSHSGIDIPTLEERAAILRKAFGAWKHRSLKKDLRLLETIRRGWDRKVG